MCKCCQGQSSAIFAIIAITTSFGLTFFFIAVILLAVNEPNASFNRNAFGAWCTTYAHSVERSTCSDGGSEGDTYTCWNGKVFFSLRDFATDVVVFPVVVKQVITGWNSGEDVRLSLISNFPIDSDRFCFYTYSGQVEFGLLPDTELFVASMVFFGLTGGLALVLVAIFVKMYYDSVTRRKETVTDSDTKNELSDFHK